ncbi:MAG: 3-phosphoshikimate 1-carboxyvinyltransferase [Polyangiaceae bacterium]|nr:3-phosphoshikimate 1-carboxyvinyltransferase [Polyangiaceae bacterium]
MTSLVVHPAEGPLVGSVPVPADKSIAHRALLFGGIANGITHVKGYAAGADNDATLAAMQQLGAEIERVGERELRIKGTGLFGLRAPAAPIDCGNSGTTMRLLSGLLAAQPFASTLVGDASLSRRPMMRIAAPLRLRGARIEGAAHPKKPQEITAPLHIGPLGEDTYLTALEFESPIASAQVKSAILLSGLFAHGVTHFREPSVSRDHTERLLSALGAPIRAMGSFVELDPAGWNGQLPGFELDVPGDLSAAAFLVTAGATVAGSRVVVRHVGLNPTRTGLLEVLRDMGARVEAEPLGEVSGEPIGNLVSAFGDLVGVTVGGERVLRSIDEVPILCVLAARASGTTTIRDAQELRTKESDRLAMMAKVLRAFGVTCEELDDGLVVQGRPGKLTAAHVESDGDHRIAMSAAILGLHADGPSRIDDADCIATSFPRFVGTLRALGARIDVA